MADWNRERPTEPRRHASSRGCHVVKLFEPVATSGETGDARHELEPTDEPEPGGISWQEFLERADRLAHKAGLSDAEEALEKLNSGELKGTLLETQIRVIRCIARSPESTP